MNQDRREVSNDEAEAMLARGTCHRYRLAIFSASDSPRRARRVSRTTRDQSSNASKSGARRTSQLDVRESETAEISRVRTADDFAPMNLRGL
jgi:hypothetical protein